MALAVFAIGLGATFYYWQNLQHGVQTEIDAAYARQTQMIGESVKTRLGVYENFLRASAGLFSVYSGLNQDGWVKYQEAYNLAKGYPDIEGTGVVRYLRASELPAYYERRALQGEPAFKIFPVGDRATYAPITFHALYNTKNPARRGFDAYTEATRRNAMERGIETNRMTMTGTVSRPVGSSDQSPTFVLYYPVYKKDQPKSTAAERKDSVSAFVYMEVNTKVFMDSILANSKSPHIGLRVYDAESDAAGSPQTLAYQSSNFDTIMSQPGSQAHNISGRAHGHNWSFTFAASPDVISTRERQLPEQALWRGLVTCLFFAGLVWYLITDRERKYARQKREEVQTAKDDLLSLASHQLRTPATVVKQYVGMLLQGYAGKLSKQQLDMLDNAYSSNERQLEIINQLLYVARLDAGRITLHHKEVNLTKLLKEIADDFKEAITARSQQVSFQVPHKPVVAFVDPHYMRMVLENLVSNAVKYTPEKGSISLELRRAGHEVVITVRDDGVGIPSNVQSTIFDKFTRVENELSTDVNGSGVGLYLTKQIVELHGGTIEVQSAVQSGSSFIVRVPIKALRPNETPPVDE